MIYVKNGYYLNYVRLKEIKKKVLLPFSIKIVVEPLFSYIILKPPSLNAVFFKYFYYKIINRPIFALMARIMCIDFGLKRCGIAVTDPFQIIVSGLDTIETPHLLDFLSQYIITESVEKIVVGLPVHKDGNFTHIKPDIDKFVKKANQLWPNIKTDFADEQYSSFQAKNIILDMGIKKKKRQDKALTDKISAVVILQKYLKHI